MRAQAKGQKETRNVSAPRVKNLHPPCRANLVAGVFIRIHLDPTVLTNAAEISVPDHAALGSLDAGCSQALSSHDSTIGL